ncbi:MAG: hypothetical protein ACFFF9_14325 [Candidatus Thorarchaeota archaeon]
MEFVFGLFVTGVFILIVTLYRMRNINRHRGLQDQLSNNYDVTGLDLSGNTRYVSCFSHKWVIDNVTKQSHSRFGSMLQDHLANNTLIAGIWIGIIVGSSSMLLTLFLVQSLRAIGTVIVIFIMGLMIALGPSGPRYSEELLDAIMDNDIEELNAQDYVYVKIANDTIRRAIIMNFSFSLLFIVLAPWGDLLPDFLAQGIAFVTVYLVWEPAIFLMGINIAASLFYIGALVGILSFVCLQMGRRLLQQEEKEPVIQY